MTIENKGNSEEYCKLIAIKPIVALLANNSAALLPCSLTQTVEQFVYASSVYKIRLFMLPMVLTT